MGGGRGGVGGYVGSVHGSESGFSTDRSKCLQSDVLKMILGKWKENIRTDTIYIDWSTSKDTSSSLHVFNIWIDISALSYVKQSQNIKKSRCSEGGGKFHKAICPATSFLALHFNSYASG